MGNISVQPSNPELSNKDFDAAVEKAKLDALKELAYGASHEINNPLANIAARAQTLLRDEIEPERRRALAAIHSQAMRAHEMISDLMLFARPPKPETEPFDVSDLTYNAVNKVLPEANERNVQVVCMPCDESIHSEGDVTQLTVAVMALLQNSLEAIGCDGRIEVQIRQTGPEPDSRVEIEITDDGPGISEEVRQHIFDPFFSGREAGRGLGFGLSKCWRIVQAHAGEVVVHSEPGRGAQFTIRLPRIVV